MDATTIAIDNLDWFINIGKYPSQYIFNRFGHLPKIFMFMYPHQGSPFEWEAHPKHNTKYGWHFKYENSLIAA
jgi:hypothetical protein